ncbi:ankyrin repeat-containing domain protein, partial [Dimargaris cristalligena]
LKGNASLVSLLLDHGAEPRLRNKDGYTPVHLASQYNQLTALQLMVRAQPSSALLATRNGRLPIHLAARQGGREVVLWFLEAASENLPAMLEAEDSAGADVLQDAVVSGSVPLLNFLLASHRLTRPEHSTGKTILHLACMANHLLVLEYLYQHDMVGDPNVRDTWDGWSPLMYSARYGDVNIIDFLIRRCQANKQLTDRHGRTALDIGKLFAILIYIRPYFVFTL